MSALRPSPQGGQFVLCGGLRLLPWPLLWQSRLHSKRCALTGGCQSRPADYRRQAGVASTVLQREQVKLDIGDYKKARIRRAVERWLGLEVTIHVHSTLNGVGSREIRVLVEYAGMIFDKKRVADAVVAGVQRPGARPRLRPILVDAQTKREVEHQRIRVLGQKI